MINFIALHCTEKDIDHLISLSIARLLSTLKVDTNCRRNMRKPSMIHKQGDVKWRKLSISKVRSKD